MKLVVRCSGLVVQALLFVVLCSSSVVAQESQSRSITIKRVSLTDELGKPVRGYKKLKRNQEIDWSSLGGGRYFLRAYPKPRKNVELSYTLKGNGNASLPETVDQDYPLPAEPGKYKLSVVATSTVRELGKGKTKVKIDLKGRGPKSTSPTPSIKPSPESSPAESPKPSPEPSPENTPEPSPSASASPVASSSPGSNPTVIARFNAGGDNYFDSNGNEWKSDSSLVKVGSHSTYTVNSAVAGTIEDSLYHTERWGNFQYSIPIAPGSYQVKLHFAEVVFLSSGERVFNVYVENTTVRSGLDIVAETGAFKAFELSANVTVNDGFLNLNFVPTVNNGKISAFEIIALEGGLPTPSPSASPSSASSPNPSASPSPSRSPGASSSPTPSPSSSPNASPSPSASSQPSASPSKSPTPTPSPGAGVVSAVWANDGGDKVTRDELRVSGTNPQNVANSVWDGSSIDIFGSRNEVVSFNVVLEAAEQAANNVSVEFNELTGPANFKIRTTPASGNGLFEWVGRNIEVFYVKYLQIKGVSFLSYDTYDERHIPERLRRPYTGAGYGNGTWSDRPDHDKYYPDIAVPIELHPEFNISAGQNQSIWVDIYIPKNAYSGNYSGIFKVKENGGTTFQIPVNLQVHNIDLPDTPNSKTMLYLGYSDVNYRYMGQYYPSGAANLAKIDEIRDRHFMMAHRHKISLIDQDNGSTTWNFDQPRPEWNSRLDGTLFTSGNGYDGPGVGVGNGVYSIGTYGSWSWQGQGESAMRQHTDAWVTWFNNNAPDTDYFLYLIDESVNFSQTNQWAQWIENNPGVGKNLRSFATLPLPDHVDHTPNLDIGAGWMAVGPTAEWQNAVDELNNDPTKAAYMYNGKRPASGTFATEDDGVALRELPWGQYKKKIERWFFWESTYYNNFQGGQGETNVFQKAQTFGGYSGFNNVYGETGWNHSNGDGVLFYPGTDLAFPAESYGIEGPLASLRLKHWRRGVQDVDYIVLAEQVDPVATANIINQMVPSVMWEPGVTDPGDPTWVRADISWSTNPDDWENARQQLINIILGN